MYKILFLDVDGVLNSGYYCKKYNCKRWLEMPKLELLKELIDETNAKIVLTSYRCQFLDQKDLLLKELAYYGIDVFDVIHDVNNKQEGIESYLSQHQSILSFAVIDDAFNPSNEIIKHSLFKTSSWWGLTKNICQKVIKHLNS